MQKHQLKAAFAAIKALQKLLEIQKIDSQTTKTKLEEKVRKLGEMVEGKEKERARLKQEMVGRGREIAVMRETVSKMKKKMEVKKSRKVPKADKLVQTGSASLLAVGTQTTVRTYASMAAQAEEVSDEGEATDKIDLDPPGSPNTPTTKGQSSGVTPTPKPTQSTTTVGHLARAYVAHGVACHGSWQAHIQEVQRAFGRKGEGVIGVRWLLQQHRRRGKAFSTLVVFLKRAVPTAQSIIAKKNIPSGCQGTYRVVLCVLCVPNAHS